MYSKKENAHYFPYLQTNLNTESKEALFPYTGLIHDQPYFCCQTGIADFIYKDRLFFSGYRYQTLFPSVFFPAIKQILARHHIEGISYLVGYTHKEIIVIFQPKESSYSPIIIAEEIDAKICQLSEECMPIKDSVYCCTTTLSDPVIGIDGIQIGCKQTEELKRLSFFRMTPGVLTRERLERLKNHVTYRDVINLTRMLCQAVAQGEDAKGLALSEQLFLDMLKHSFDTELVCDALSYLKQFLSIRLSVYLPQESFDLRALCGIASYITIEECFEALSPVLTTLCHTVKSTGAWSDSVVYAAYYLRNNIAKDVSLPEIAAFADTAPAYLSNQFHQQTGMTIKQYQQKIRMELACELLEKSSERISDIAGKTGFFDRRYFTKTFKDTFGTTPAQYREHHRVGQKDQNGTI